MSVLSSRIVVVDDEPVIADMICAIFEDMGCETIACTRAWEAVATICREFPALILLDVQMVGIDGIEVFHLVRSNPVTLDIPVIFLTANPYIVRERLPDYGARKAALLPKPFHLPALHALVQRLLPSASIAAERIGEQEGLSSGSA